MATARRKRKRRTDRRGVALVMVLGAITVLTVLLTELQEHTSSELSAALAERDALRAEYYAKSALNLGRMLVATEPTIRTAVTPIFALSGKAAPQIPVWAFSDMVLGPFNCPEASEEFKASIGVDTSSGKNLGLGSGKGCFRIKIIDEDSKINVNIPSRGDVISLAQLGSQ